MKVDDIVLYEQETTPTTNSVRVMWEGPQLCAKTLDETSGATDVGNESQHQIPFLFAS